MATLYGNMHDVDKDIARLLGYEVHQVEGTSEWGLFYRGEMIRSYDARIVPLAWKKIWHFVPFYTYDSVEAICAERGWAISKYSHGVRIDAGGVQIAMPWFTHDGAAALALLETLRAA